MAGSKTILKEVAVLRPIAILLLIFMHSFTVFNGSWAPFEGFVPIEGYRWCARVSNSFLMELFVFLSGYVLAYQKFALKKDIKWTSFVWKKFKHLMVPSIVFSLFYVILLSREVLDFSNLLSIVKSLMLILEGYAHMWFLPMLFWCSIFGILLLRIKGHDYLVLLVLFVLSLVLGLCPLPFRLDKALYYLPFFYFGCIIFKSRRILEDVKFCHILLWTVVFIFAFLSTQLYVNPLCESSNLNLFGKGSLIVVSRLCKIIYALSALLVVFSVTFKCINRSRDLELPGWLIYFNSLCFGMYLYQQFILQFVYYHTSLPTCLGPYVLPWVGFLVATFLSFFLAVVTKKTRFGRAFL